MTFALLTLLTLCPSSADATQALQQQSWGTGLSVVVEAGAPTGLEVLLGRLLQGHVSSFRR